LFACNPGSDIRNGLRSDLFQVVNFGNDPDSGFRYLRAVQPTGPLMCGEFYPGWFDTWGAPHHLGNTPRYLRDLESMLKRGASFSIYMAHGGTTFGMWSGTDRPFKPDTSSYDYDAPISEAGWVGAKFAATRDLLSKYLAPGEKLPEPGPANPVMSVPSFTLGENAALFDNLPTAVEDDTPRNMEAYDQGRGSILYRTTLPAGPAATLEVGQPHDFMWVLLDGKQIGVLDRRYRRHQVSLPARATAAQLDILVEAVGHVNYGNEMHDRKGLQGAVSVTGPDPVSFGKWQVYRFGMDTPMLASLKWKNGATPGPGFWRGSFTVDQPQDTFLDLRSWGKGVVWVNGHCLARFWNIGPTQSAYVPGPWLHSGRNEVVVFDLLGPAQPEMAGLEKPILNQLRPELDFNRKSSAKGHLAIEALTPTFTGSFAAGAQAQEVRFPQPVEGRQFCLEGLNAHDDKPYAAIAELDLLDADGKSISHATWTIAYADSEEQSADDGSASNAINGQTADFWHTAWTGQEQPFPHQIVIDLGSSTRIGGFRYTPRSGEYSTGHIKDYRVYVGSGLVHEAAQ
jgi:beta-galactosidase